MNGIAQKAQVFLSYWCPRIPSQELQGAIFLLEGPADVRVGGARGKQDEQDDCVYCRVVKYLLSRGNEYLFLHTKTAFSQSPWRVEIVDYGIGLYYYYYYYYYCRGANRRNRYTENPPNCMGGIREFNCACLIISLLLALLLNTSLSFTLPCIICLVFYRLNKF